MTHDLGLTVLWKANGQLSIRLKTFPLFVTVPEWRNVYSSAVFAGGRLLCTQILPRHGRPPPTILGTRKLETLSYPTVEIASLCVPSF